MRLFILASALLFSNLARAESVSICSVAGENARKSENLLGALTMSPTPAFFVMSEGNKARFVPPASIYTDVLQTAERSIIINHVEELRFIPQTLAHSNVLLVLDGKKQAEWDQEKSRKVLSVAKLLDIKVSMVWLGEKSSPKILRDMVVKSGGTAYETQDLVRRVDQLCRESLASK